MAKWQSQFCSKLRTAKGFSTNILKPVKNNKLRRAELILYSNARDAWSVLEIQVEFHPYTGQTHKHNGMVEGSRNMVLQSKSVKVQGEDRK